MSQFVIGGRGSDFKPKCPIFLCPKVPREGGCQVRMGQCLIFLFFFLFFFFLKASLTLIIYRIFFIYISLYLKKRETFHFTVLTWHWNASSVSRLSIQNASPVSRLGIQNQCPSLIELDTGYGFWMLNLDTGDAFECLIWRPVTHFQCSIWRLVTHFSATLARWKEMFPSFFRHHQDYYEKVNNFSKVR